MSTTWQEVRAADLTVAQLYDALRLRSEVFVVEQDCPYQDVDGLDLLAGTWHVLGHDGALVAYARILEATDARAHSGPTDGLRIGRVLVDGSRRGQRLGRELMQRCLDLCSRERPGASVVLSAQAHLQDFYASLGFVATGEPYDEDGIPHVEMLLTP